MSDALISIPTSTFFWGVSLTSIVYSSKKLTFENKDRLIPLMSVLSALIFSLQMVNFTIPMTGSSGHFAGGYLLTLILGPYLAFLAMASVLIVQALFFADGGILALGCNIFNLGFVPSFIVYPLIKYYLKDTKSNLSIWLGAFLSLMLGAVMVSIQTALSGLAEIPFSKMIYLMTFIHFLISIVEGIITVGSYKIISKISNLEDNNIEIKNSLISLLFISLIISTIFSLFASEKPDGLEWSIFNIIGKEGEPESILTKLHHYFSEIQNSISLLPDYNFKENKSTLGTSISGLVGTIIMVIFSFVLGLLGKRLSK